MTPSGAPRRAAAAAQKEPAGQGPSNGGRVKAQRAARPSKRGEIVAAGIRLFTKRPYDAVSIDDVADEAGVAHGLIYYYYRDKRSLFAAAVHHVSEEFLDFQRPRAGEVTPEERLYGALTRHFEYVRDNPDRYRLLMPGTHPDNSLQESLRKKREEALRTHFCIPNPPPLVWAAAQGWVGFLDRVTQVWLENAGAGLEETVDLCMQTLAAMVEVAFGRRFDAASVLPVLTHDADRLEPPIRIAG